MFTLGKKLGTAAIIALAFIGSAQATVLDSFDYGTDNFNNSYDLSDPVSDSWDILNINAAGADVRSTVALSDEENTIKTENSIGGALGVLSISTDVTASMTALLSYGALDATPAGPLDLTFAGTDDSFYFDVVKSEAAGFTTKVTVTYLMEVAPAVFVPATSMISFATSLVTSVEREYVAFASFVGADFTKVVGVDVLLTGVEGADLTIAEFGTIPEPSTVAIFGLALVGFAFSSRRKAK